MSDNTAPKLQPPPFFLMKSKHEFDCLDPSGTMAKLRHHFSDRPDSVINWMPERWHKFKVFVFGGKVYSRLVITLYHIDGTRNVIEVHEKSGDRIQYTVLKVVEKILSGDEAEASDIKFVNALKPPPFPEAVAATLPRHSDESIERGWRDVTRHFASIYVEHYQEGMKIILSLIDDRTPHFVLEALCEDLVSRTPPDSLLQSRILYLFLQHHEQWEKLTEDEKGTVNDFVTTTLASVPDERSRNYLSQLMLKKMGTQFRETYPLSA